MLNPLFNLPSFLIGMYFGLVNFTIQRGVNISFKDVFDTKIELFGRSSKVSISKENKREIIVSEPQIEKGGIFSFSYSTGNVFLIFISCRFVFLILNFCF